MPRGFFRAGLGFFRSDFCQFPGIQPIPAAVGTFIHFDAPFAAEKMPLQLDAGAAGTFEFASWIEEESRAGFDNAFQIEPKEQLADSSELPFALRVVRVERVIIQRQGYAFVADL